MALHHVPRPLLWLHGRPGGHRQGPGASQDKQKAQHRQGAHPLFLHPLRPLKGQGGRTRNLPQHDPAKWELVQKYCRQDVVTEMEIERRLSAFPVPDLGAKAMGNRPHHQRQGRGCGPGAGQRSPLSGGHRAQDPLMEAMQLSSLSNPNSVAQLTTWLQEEIGEELADLRKDTVARLLGRDDNSPQVQPDAGDPPRAGQDLHQKI